MGGSFSDDSKSHKSLRSKSSFNSYVKTIKHYKYHSSQAERLERLKKWRQVLTDLITAEDSQETELWSALKEYISTIPDDMTIQWIANAQSSSLSASTYSSQFSARRERTVLDLDKFIEEKSDPKKSLGVKQWPTMSARTTQVSDSRMSTITMSSKMLDSQMLYEFQSRFSAKQELRKNLVSQIYRSNHIVLVLIKGFCSACNSMFKQYEDISLEEYTDHHEDVYNRIVTAIKEFLNVVESFVGWIYEDLIKQLADGLDQEDVDPAYVIQSVICSILFKTLSPNLMNLIYSLINLKYKDDVKRFKDVLQAKLGESLESYDEILKNAKAFLLESSTKPYEKVYNKIKKIPGKTNPYSKFDIITSLDDEMWECVCDVHKDDAKLAKLRESFGTELRFPVLIYCVVQSQCENLLAEMKFIEEIVSQKAMDSSIGYTLLASSLNFLLYEDAEVENGSLEL